MAENQHKKEKRGRKKGHKIEACSKNKGHRFNITN